jgi:hypothetical protein
MDQYRCTAPSCEFTAKSVKIAYSHKEQTGHTLELVGSGSQPSPDPTGAFGAAVMTDGPYRYFLIFTDDHMHWEKQTWGPKSSKIPARVEHDQISYSKIKSIAYEEIDLGPTSLFNRERKVWKGWYIILTNGMRFPVTDDGKNGQMIVRIKERMKLDDGTATQKSSSAIPTREVIKEFREVVLIQCRSCGSRYQQGTPRCLTCGANL